MDFWKNKKVFLTGHTGFKGAWLSLWLQKLGARITGFSLAAEDTSLFNICRVADGMTSITSDIRNISELQLAIGACQPEIIIHMAAQAFVRPSYINPVDTFATNVMGTVNLLDASRHAESVKVIVNVTSDKCYENQEWIWGYREVDALGGHDPYSCSKGCAELVTSAFRRSFFQEKQVAVASVRAGNVIGGGDWGRDRLIPDLIKGFMEGEPVNIRYPDAVRPWQHVCEPLGGYLLLAEKLWFEGERFAGPWNFGPRMEDSRSVAQVADTLCAYWGEGASWQKQGQSHPHEAGLLTLDCSKARNQLDWQPKLNLSTALAWTIQWYRAYQEKLDMKKITGEQIERYQSL